MNIALSRRVLEPLERLDATLERSNALDPGRRIDVGGPDDEIGVRRTSAVAPSRHRENVLAKLGMRDRVLLTRHAIQQGIIDAPAGRFSCARTDPIRRST